MDSLIYFVATYILEILNVSAVYILFNTFFYAQVKNRKFEIFCYVMYYILGLFLNYIKIPLVLVLINTVLFFAITFNYVTSLKKRFLSALLVSFLLMSCELVALIIMNYKFPIYRRYEFDSQIIYFVYSFVLSMAVLIMYYLKKIQNSKFIYYLYYGCILADVVILVFLGRTQLNLNTKTILSLFMLIVNYIVIGFYDQNLIKTRLTNEKTVLVQQKNSYQKQIEIMTMYTTNSNSFRHILIKQCLQLQESILTNDNKMALEQLDILGNLMIEVKHVNTNVIPIDSILNYKIFEAEYCGIDIDHKVVIPFDIPYDDFDMTILFGNLFDFSIGENKLLDPNDKKIKLEVLFNYDMQKKGWLNIKVHHKAVESCIDRLTGNFNSIDNIVSQYNGNFVYGFEKGTNNFELSIRICLLNK